MLFYRAEKHGVKFLEVVRSALNAMVITIPM
jgi:hypothetical protein